jgi:predicted transglutaminase-like cysteine proteinase
VPLTTGEVLIKWSGVVADIRAESDILARCRDEARTCPPAAQKFLAVIADGLAHDGRARIGVINRAINLAIQPMSDAAQWGVPDRWSGPLATFTTGRGDCEDYAIAKYVALREAGIAEDDVRLVIVRDLAVDEDHAVVAARLDEQWIVLDNRRLTLVEDTGMPRVVPLFVLGSRRRQAIHAHDDGERCGIRRRTLRARLSDFPADRVLADPPALADAAPPRARSAA